MQSYDLLLISVDSPILLGVYSDGNLIKSFSKEGKFSHTLPNIFNEILQTCPNFRIYYANGPGNFSAIKLTHIFLQSISITKNIPLFCTDAFAFSNNDTINAYGKIHFVKHNGQILTKQLSQKMPNAFALPKTLDTSIFSTKCEPLYILPAV